MDEQQIKEVAATLVMAELSMPEWELLSEEDASTHLAEKVAYLRRFISK